MQKLIKFIASFFYLGYVPQVPGTFGSLGGVVLYLLVKDSPLAYLALIFVVVILGFQVCGRAERLFGQKDSKEIVIDDAAGILVAFLFVPTEILLLVIGFFLYRALDVLKPYPIRAIENLPGSAGVMLDDLVAGVYTNLSLQIAVRVLM